MSESKKTEKEIIAEFEKMLASDQPQTKSASPPFFGQLSRAQFDRYLRQIVQQQLQTKEYFSSQPVNIYLDHSRSPFLMKILVFSGSDLPPLPTQFWHKQENKKYLLKNEKPVKWDHFTMQVFSDPVGKRLEAQLPVQKIEVELQELSLDEKESEQRFLESVRSDVNHGEPNLKLLLTECVYQQSRQEEFKILTEHQNDTDSFMKVRKEFYEKNMAVWMKSLEQFTAGQKSKKIEIFVSQFKTDGTLLSQDVVDDLLKAVSKK